MHPKMNAVQSGFPGCSYFSINQPNRIIDMLTPKMPIIAAMSVMETSAAISTTISEELNAYSIQRK